jgi:hypothetical protein
LLSFKLINNKRFKLINNKSVKILKINSNREGKIIYKIIIKN